MADELYAVEHKYESAAVHAYLTKMNQTDGAIAWRDALPDGKDWFLLAADSLGNAYVAWEDKLRKVSPSQVTEWEKTMASAFAPNELLPGLEIADNGYLYAIVGTDVSKISLAAGTVATTYDMSTLGTPNAVMIGIDGYVYVSGTTGVAKLSTNLVEQWAKTTGVYANSYGVIHELDDVVWLQLSISGGKTLQASDGAIIDTYAMPYIPTTTHYGVPGAQSRFYIAGGLISGPAVLSTLQCCELGGPSVWGYSMYYWVVGWCFGGPVAVNADGEVFAGGCDMHPTSLGDSLAKIDSSGTILWGTMDKTFAMEGPQAIACCRSSFTVSSWASGDNAPTGATAVLKTAP